MEFLTKYFLEIVFGLISAGLLALCKHLHNQNKELQDLKKEESNRQWRKYIVEEINPIADELVKIKEEINDVDLDAKISLATFKVECEKEHEKMYKDLDAIQNENIKNFNLIINSYKFRLIQLCKSHLRDGYITESDYEQISEMYKLYHGLGGNGQAQEYYDKVLKLELRPDEKE